MQLRNRLRELKTAHEKGQPIDELSPVWETHRLPPEDDLVKSGYRWLRIENEAVIACQRQDAESIPSSVMIQVP